MGSAERDIYVHLPWAVFTMCHALEKCCEQTFRCNFSCMKKDGKQPTVAACNVRVYRDVWDIVTLQATGIDEAVSPLSESCHFYLSDMTTDEPRAGEESCDREESNVTDVPDVAHTDVAHTDADHGETQENKGQEKNSSLSKNIDDNKDREKDYDDMENFDTAEERPICVKTETTSPQNVELAHRYNTRRKERVVWTSAMTPVTKATSKDVARAESKTDIKSPKVTSKSVTKAGHRLERRVNKTPPVRRKSFTEEADKNEGTAENETVTMVTSASEKPAAHVVDEANTIEQCEDDETGALVAMDDSYVLSNEKHISEDESEKCELCHKYLKNARSLYHHILWSHKTHPLSKTYRSKVSESLYLKCDVCNKKVFGESGLVQHMQRVHKQMKKVKCLVCDAMLKNKQTMIDHLRKTHKLNSRERFLRFGAITKVCPEESLQIRKKLKTKRAKKLGQLIGEESLDTSGLGVDQDISELDTSLVNEDSSSKENDSVNVINDTVNVIGAGIDGSTQISEVHYEEGLIVEEFSGSKEQQKHATVTDEEAAAVTLEIGEASDNDDDAMEVNREVCLEENEESTTNEQPAEKIQELTSPAEKRRMVTSPPAKKGRLNLSDQDLEKYVMNPQVRLGRRPEQNVCCPICKRWLKSAYSVYCHMSAEHRGHPDLEVQRKAMYEKCRTQCSDCGKFFGNINLYKHHYRRFHAKEAFQPKKCSMCSVTCRNAMCLKEHIAKYHVQHRNICQQCGTTFPKQHQLRTHEHIKHGMHPELEDKIYRFKCEYCSRRFYANTSYQKHLNAHTGNKPHLCDHCGRSFSSSESLKRHRIKVHLVDEQGNAVTPHVQYECQMCEQGFPEQHLLNEHMDKVHHIPPQYICSDCDQRFYSTDELKRHLEETHAVVCTLCDATLAGPAAYNEHLMEVHNAQEVVVEQGVVEEGVVAGDEELELKEVAVYVPHTDMLSDNVVVLCTMNPEGETVTTETIVMKDGEEEEGACIAIDAAETVALAAIQSGIGQVEDVTEVIKEEERTVQ